MTTCFSRAALAALALGGLSACSSSGDTGFGQTGEVLYTIIDAALFSEETAASSGKTMRQMVEERPYASIGVTIDHNPQFLFLLANQSADGDMYTLGYQVSLVLRDGRVVRTQGLARDVLGGRWEGEDIIRTAMRSGAPAKGVRYFESNEFGVKSLKAECVATPVKDETITIIGRSFVARYVKEDCVAPALKWRYENHFWLTPEDGRIWLSIQNVHPEVNPLIIETFRPPQKFAPKA